MTQRTSHRAVISAALAAAAVGFVSFGYHSDAAARNNGNRWDEECWSEGCDNEEREEMYDLGSFAEEAYTDWWINNEKPKYQATFEIAELAAPDRTGADSWNYCRLMIDDFTNVIGKSSGAINPIRDDCTRRIGNFPRPH